MAIAGLTLVVFLLVHLLGLLPALAAPAIFERSATALHHQPWLPLLELLLLGLLLTHPLLALAQTWRQRAALGPGPRVLRSKRAPAEQLAARAGRWMPWSGLLLLLFLALHLFQLRWQRPGDGQELVALQAALAQPWSLALYSAAGVALGLHLLHGVEAAHRRLGWWWPDQGGAIRSVGRTVAWLLAFGFTLLPLALVLQP